MFSAGFDGDYQLNSSRRVDLRGRSRQQSREDTLKRARLERERRALERRRFSAALVIQKTIRSIRTLRRARAEMEAETHAAQFSNLDINALDEHLDLHKLLFCTNAASIASLTPLITSIVQELLISVQQFETMASSSLSQIHSEVTLIRILDACLSILSTAETESLKEVPNKFVDTILESSYFRKVLVKHIGMDWMLKRNLRYPRHLWKLVEHFGLSESRDRTRSLSLQFTLKIFKETAARKMPEFVNDLLEHVPSSEEGTAFISQLFLSDWEVAACLASSCPTAARKALRCFVTCCGQEFAEEQQDYKGDEKLRLLYIIMTLTHLVGQSQDRKDMHLIDQGLSLMQNLLSENRDRVVESIERISFSAQKTQKTRSPSFKSASEPDNIADFSLVYSDLFLRNMTRMAFGDGTSHCDPSSLPSCFDESSLSFLVSFCAFCEKTIALGVFPRSRVLSSLSYNTELNFIHRLWGAFRWLKQNMDGEAGSSVLSLFCFILSNVLSTTLDEEILDITKCQTGVNSAFLKDITPTLKQCLLDEILRYQARLSRSKAKIESLGSTDILKLSTVVRKMHYLNSRIEFIDPEVFCAERFQIDRLKIQAQKIAQRPQELEEVDPNEDASGVEVIPPGLQGFDPKSTIILQFAPYLIPFKTRVEIFQLLIHRDRSLVRSRNLNSFGVAVPKMVIQVRRDNIFEDGFNQLSGKPLSPSSAEDSRHEEYAPLMYQEMNLSPSRVRRFLPAVFAGLILKGGIVQGQSRLHLIVTRYVVNYASSSSTHSVLLSQPSFAGVDGGGLLREFLEKTIKAGLNENFGLFERAAENTVYPCPSASVTHENGSGLRYLDFMGQIVGKAMYEGMLVDLPFATFFLKKFLGLDADLNDLPSLDPELYKNLVALRDLSKPQTAQMSDEDPLHSLELFFVLDDHELGQLKQVELLPNGKDIRVTRENVIRYIHLAVHYKLNKRIRLAASAFLSGLFEVIRPEYMRMFHAHELQILISGVQVDKIDVEDLRRNCEVPEGAGQQQVLWLWEVLSEMSGEDQKLFLKFVTSSSRPPLLGFSALEPKFSIAVDHTRSGADLLQIDEFLAEEETAARASSFLPFRRRRASNREAAVRLPTASTCANLLKLPRYKSKEQLRDKLLLAIRADSGFEFS